MRARLTGIASPSAYIPFIIVGVCALAIVIGMGVAAFDVEGKEYGIVLLALAAIPVIVTTDERLMKLSFGGWILTLASGPRAFYVTPALPIHIGEAIAWLLFAALTFRELAVHRKLKWHVPLALTLFMAWVSFQAWVRPGNPNIESVLFEWKQYVVGIPVFGLVFYFVNAQNWRRYMWLFVASGAALVLWGLATRSGITGASDISARLTVPGWVTVYAFYLVLTIGFALAELALAKTPRQRVLVAGVLFLLLFGIYEAAYRGIWIATVVGLVFYGIFHFVLVLPIFGAAFVLVFLNPAVLEWRVELLQEGDTSVMKRQERLGYALDSFQQNPVFGLGTAANVGVHNDIAQMLANGGLVAAGLFFAWYAGLAWRGFKLLFNRDAPEWLREHALGALITLVMVGIALVLESFFTVEYVSVAFWFALAMVARLLAPDLAANETT